MTINNLDQATIITIERHILEEQSGHPEATGSLTSLLYDIALAGKLIASRTTRAGLAEILGSTADVNIQGETVMKLDQLADQSIYRLNDHTGRLACMASEEHEGILPIPDRFKTGKYVLLYDPLDGSSNIDYNASIGTIFAIYRRIISRRPRYAGRLPAAGPRHGRGRLHDLRLEHHAGLHQRARRARLYPRPGDRRIPAHPPQHPHPVEARSITASTRATSATGARASSITPTTFRGLRATTSRSRRATSARWSAISTATCSPAACTTTPPMRKTLLSRMASCAWSTSAPRSPSSPPRQAAAPPMVSRISWTSPPPPSTSVSRLFIGNCFLVEKPPKISSVNTINLRSSKRLPVMPWHSHPLPYSPHSTTWMATGATSPTPTSGRHSFRSFVRLTTSKSTALPAPACRALSPPSLSPIAG